jgi:hypothetical protein
LYDSTVVTNGRCLIGEGKIMASTVDAKKGVYAKTIGSEASHPCNLTVGIDRLYQRDMAACEEELASLKQRLKEAEKVVPELQERLASTSGELGALAQEQDSFMVQKRQFEQQLSGEGPNPVKGDEERLMLEEMIAELEENNKGIELRVDELMQKEDRIKKQFEGLEKGRRMLESSIEKIREQISLLDDNLAVDPGIPVIKVSGTIYSKTHIITRSKEMILPKDMTAVRIAESLSDTVGHKYQIKISGLR